MYLAKAFLVLALTFVLYSVVPVYGPNIVIPIYAALMIWVIAFGSPARGSAAGPGPRKYDNGSGSYGGGCVGDADGDGSWDGGWDGGD